MSSNSKGTSARNFDRVLDLSNPHAIPEALFDALDSGLSTEEILNSTSTSVEAMLWLYLHQPSVLATVDGHSGSIKAPVSALEILNTLLSAPSEVPTVSLLDVFTSALKLRGGDRMLRIAKAYKAALNHGITLGLDDEGYLHIALSFVRDYATIVIPVQVQLASKHAENPGSLTIDEDALYTQLGNIDETVKAADESDDGLDFKKLSENLLVYLGGLITTSALTSLASAISTAVTSANTAEVIASAPADAPVA